jgi:hypothetical protein
MDGHWDAHIGTFNLLHHLVLAALVSCAIPWLLLGGARER